MLSGRSVVVGLGNLYVGRGKLYVVRGVCK